MQRSESIQTLIEPLKIMQLLGQYRPLFHSEADFQHAFAWELHHSAPGCDVRLEVPVRTGRDAIHLDLLVRSQLGQVAIELKYKTRALTTTLNGEDFKLMNHAAQDLGRYDFFKDLRRVEVFAQAAPDRTGYVIFLTNDSAYWKVPSVLDHGYAEFSMNEGRNISGNLCWGGSTSEGTRRGRQEELAIRGCYSLRWNSYSSLEVKSYGEFRYLCIQAAAT